jgi:hypothetical protein
MADAAMQQLLACLQGTLDPNAESRNAAEAALEAGSKQPGYGVSLLKVTIAQDVSQDLRQVRCWPTCITQK